MSDTTAPNILMLCTDQQRFDTLGCYGNIHAHTPNLDRLAEQGAVFEQCYVQNTICSPSRASLFTGMYARNHGLWANGVSMPEHRKMFTRVLADAGYDCGMIGKQHLSPVVDYITENRYDDGYRVFEWAHDPIHRATTNAYLRWLRKTYPDLYDQTFPVEANPDKGEAGNQARGATPMDVIPTKAHFSHWVADRAIAFIEEEQERDADQPFFLIANFFDPHHPFGAPEEFRKLIDADAVPGPIRADGELATKPAVQTLFSEKSYAGWAPGFQEYSDGEIKELRAAYLAMVALIDAEVGRVLDALEASGQADNTLVVFTTDHGEMLGDHEQMLKGPMMYDGCTRVPLIMRWPRKIPAKQRVENLVQWIDLTATYLDVSNAKGDHYGQGSSLMALFSDASDWRN